MIFSCSVRLKAIMTDLAVSFPFQAKRGRRGGQYFKWWAMSRPGSRDSFEHRMNLREISHSIETQEAVPSRGHLQIDAKQCGL